MKKSVILLMLLLMLTSCNVKNDNEIAVLNVEPEQTDSHPSSPTKTTNEQIVEKDRTDTDEVIEDEIKEEVKDITEDDAIKIDGYVVFNDGLISKEMQNRDYQYVLGACGYSPSTLESLTEMSDLIVIATPSTTFDEAEQIWRSGNYPTTDFNSAEMATSYTKRAFTVKKF